MKVSVFTSPLRNDQDIKKEIVDKLINAGFSIDDINPEIVIYLGGDGTFLRSVHHYIDKLSSVKFVGICIGTLGFFYDYEPKDLDQLIDDLLKQNYKVHSHSLLETKIEYEDKSETIYGVNEIRIENPFHTLICDVFINGEYLETFRGNGLLACSSLGSTAYNKSLGGALLPHRFDLLELTEIVSIQNNAFNSVGNPIILDNTNHITLKGNWKKAIVGFDYSTSENISPISLDIFLSDKKVSLIRPTSYSYLNTIRKSFIK